MKPAVDIREYGYQYPDRKAWALSGLTLSVQPGECVCVTGPSGCGKSTLFLAIKGLLKEGRKKGAIQLANGNGHGHAGLVFQNAESQLLCTTVADEVAFGPQHFGFGREEILKAVQMSLKTVSLTGFESRNVETLSAGQAHRLAIASVISTAPNTLLLDEPTAQLDAPGKTRLKEMLEEMKRSGCTLMIADHELGPFESLADRYVFMDRGRIDRIDERFPSALSLSPKRQNQSRASGTVKTEAPLVSVEGLFISGSNGRPLFDHLNLRLMPGRRTFIHGHNGAGKSTLLKCMAGLVRPQSGTVHVTGLGRPLPGRLLGKMAILFQNPERQLFEEAVEDEVAFTLKRMGLKAREIRARVEEVLEMFGVDHLRKHSPLTLSFGEQHRVTLASIMAPRPRILMLDEPFAGLDLARRKRLLGILSRLCKEKGTTVVIASHEFLPEEDWADETFILKGGHIEASQ